MYRRNIIVVPPANQPEGISPAADGTVHIQHIICEFDLSVNLGINAKSIQCSSIHDDLVFLLWHMSFAEVDIAPFRIVVVHVAYLRRNFCKASIRDDPGSDAPTDCFDLRVAFYHRSLLTGHILEGSVRIPSDLTECIGFIARVNRHHDREKCREQDGRHRYGHCSCDVAPACRLERFDTKSSYSFSVFHFHRVTPPVRQF